MAAEIISVADFRTTIWDYYRCAGRSFEWRHTHDPYHIFISEVMLQQTQTYRVAPKYQNFIQRFPDVHSLANASLKEVLEQWQGLGYNRRGMYLHNAAQQIVNQYGGIIPSDPQLLIALPGIGPYTAASICAFAYNKPTVFIETNIRAVFIYFFFANQEKVHDKQIMPLVETMLDATNPREWYYALMDYGVMLKKMLPNPSRKSAHHVKQSKFEGSDRQIRGMILRVLMKTQQPIQLKNLSVELEKDLQRVVAIVDDMVNEKLLESNESGVSIALR